MDPTEREGAFIITSSGGNGHKDVANVLKTRQMQTSSNLKVSDVMLDFLGDKGAKAVNRWNTAWQKGDIKRLQHLVKLHPAADLLYKRQIHSETLKALRSFAIPPIKVINTQVLGIGAITSALLEYNRGLNPEKVKDFKPVRMEIWLTDFPEKADHFYGPIKRLNNQQKKLLQLVSPLPRKMTEKEAYLFLLDKTGLPREQIRLITDKELPVDNRFYMKIPDEKRNCIQLDSLEQNKRKEFLTELPNTKKHLDLEKQEYRIGEHDKVFSILLGSQPNKQALEKSIEQMTSLAKQANDPNQKIHYIVFCGKEESTFESICGYVSELDISPNLTILPLPFQDPVNIAAIQKRSQKKIVRSSGSTSFGTTAISQSQQNTTSETLIWSENPSSYYQLSTKGNMQKELRKAIPFWEKGNAIHLGSRCISKRTFSHILANEFHQCSNTEATSLRNKDVEFFGKASAMINDRPNGLRRFWYWLSGKENHRLRKTSHQFTAILDSLESISVKIGGSGAQTQKVDFLHYLDMAENLKRRISGKRSLKKEILMLDRRIVALRYRITAQNGGFTPNQKALSRETRTTEDKQLVYQLTQLAEKWKRGTFKHSHTKVFTEQENRKLVEAASYNEFSQLLLNDPSLCEEFFNWTFNYGLSVDVFVEYASVSQFLPKSLLEKIGRVCQGKLQIKTEKGQKKLTLTFFHKDEKGNALSTHHPVLDHQKEVSVGQGSRKKIGKILEEVAPFQFEDQKYEVFEDGIKPWSPTAFLDDNGNKIDLSRDNWWLNLPVFKTVTVKEVEERYGPTNGGHNWLLSPRTSHATETLDFGDNHAYVDIVIPIGNGHYRIYPFGRMSQRHPETIWEKLNFLGNTMLGNVVYPDPLAFAKNRRNTGIAIAMNERVGRDLMLELGRYISDGIEEKLLFQLLNENCALFVQKLIDYVREKSGAQEVVEPYRTHVLAVQPSGISGLLLRSPKKLRKPMIKALGHIFRAGKPLIIEGKEYRLKNSDFWNKFIVHHPVNLSRSLEEGSLKPIYEWRNAGRPIRPDRKSYFTLRTMAAKCLCAE